MADTYALLTETLERLAHATGERRDRLSDTFDAKELVQLSYETGLPVAVVVDLLNGGRAPRTSVSDRVRQRLVFLRETRRREDGGRYTYAELGEIAGVSRQALTAWFDTGVPNLESADLLRRHFGASAGFLTADEPEVLNEALQPKLMDAQATMGSLTPELQASPAFRRIATRARDMSDEKLEALAKWADMITERG
ncbi:XRE family transcriptional regulator [Streptomyces sp. NPDC059371]|uniref:XRE family transcriptional regulator n=1 Tax=Streptomyces sp. NPDC059371 TaxID=3346812 RepID=UPI0036834DA9